MGNLSLVFHVFSFIVLFALSIVVFRQATMLRLWRDWNRPSVDVRVTVGEPLRILRLFSAAIGARFECDVPLGSLPVAKVSLTACFDLHRKGRLLAIEIEKRENIWINFVLAHEPDTIAVDLDSLKRELGGHCRVALKKM